MRKTLTIIVAFLYSLCGSAQDTITLKNGNVIRAHILVKSDNYIKYKPDSIKYSHTTFVTGLTNVRTIRYCNGEVDLLSSQNPRSIFQLGVHAAENLYYNRQFLTVGIDYLFNPKISAELNIGGFTGYLQNNFRYSFGGKLWFAGTYSKSGFSPFTGLLYGKNASDRFFEMPVGISYIAKFGLQTSLQLNLLKNINREKYLSDINLELRLGWRFKTYK